MDSAANSRLPLAGITVIELGMVLAGPFAGSLLADLGATVIKIEPPGTGDGARQMGPRKNGVALWWGVAQSREEMHHAEPQGPGGMRVVRAPGRKRRRRR